MIISFSKIISEDFISLTGIFAYFIPEFWADAARYIVFKGTVCSKLSTVCFKPGPTSEEFKLAAQLQVINLINRPF